MSRAGRYIPMHLYDPPPRPGSPPAAGETLLTDDMEGPLNWTGSGTGADWTVALTAAAAHSPSHSLDLTTRVTDPTAGDVVTATYTTTYPLYPQLTLTAEINLGALLSQGPTDWIVRVNAGAHKYSAGLRYQASDGTWHYWDALGALQPIAALAGVIAADTWVHVSLVVTLTSHQYVSASVDALSADLSGLAIEDDGPEAAAYTQFTVQSSTLAGLAQGAYYDDIDIAANPDP